MPRPGGTTAVALCLTWGRARDTVCWR
jgi:hypothetical protein